MSILLYLSSLKRSSLSTLRKGSSIIGATAFALVLVMSLNLNAAGIDNTIASGTLGHWSVDVLNGGESRTANLTAFRADLSSLVTTDVMYDYFTYIDIGKSSFRLSDSTITSAATITGTNEVSSSGYFSGANGNKINWTAKSSIGALGSRMNSNFSFSSANSNKAIGKLRLFQYMDEDVLGSDNDVLLTRGSASNSNLELFTLDDRSLVGVSHSGALNKSQGLSNASFAGWAADSFDNMKNRLTAGTQSVSRKGAIRSRLGAPYTHTAPGIGKVYGPTDIVSALAWDVDASKSTSTIVTSLGGVPDTTQLVTPVVSSKSMTINSGDTVKYQFVATDSDGDIADLRWGMDGFQPGGADYSATLRNGSSKGLFQWDSAGVAPGTYVAHVTATDLERLIGNGYLTITVVPEPSSAMLVSLSLLGLGFRRRRRS